MQQPLIKKQPLKAVVLKKTNSLRKPKYSEHNRHAVNTLLGSAKFYFSIKCKFKLRQCTRYCDGFKLAVIPCSKFSTRKRTKTLGQNRARCINTVFAVSSAKSVWTVSGFQSGERILGLYKGWPHFGNHSKRVNK